MAPRCRSRMKLPSSETKAVSPFIRKVISRPGIPRAAISSSRRTRLVCQPKRITSTGSANAPSRATRLAASEITIIRSDAVATIFSCRCAPPPPLIRFSSGSNSSAPSMVRSSHFAASSVTTLMPSSRAIAAVRDDVGTAMTRRPSPRTRSPSRLTMNAAVEPVPRPSRIPSCTKSTARRAAARFAVSAAESPGAERSACMGRSPD